MTGDGGNICCTQDSFFFARVSLQASGFESAAVFTENGGFTNDDSIEWAMFVNDSMDPA